MAHAGLTIFFRKVDASACFLTRTMFVISPMD